MLARAFGQTEAMVAIRPSSQNLQARRERDERNTARMSTRSEQAMSRSVS
jgi:hypothetical protein